MVNAETGEMLEGVQSVTWKGSVDEPPTAVIEVAFTDAQIELQPDEYKVLLRAARKKKRPGWWGWLKEVLGGR